MWGAEEHRLMGSATLAQGRRPGCWDSGDGFSGLQGLAAQAQGACAAEL